MTDLTTETIDELQRQRARIDAELERRSKEETRTVYAVQGAYGRETHKHLESARKWLLEEIAELSESDFSVTQPSITIKITPVEWSLSEYAARSDVVYG